MVENRHVLMECVRCATAFICSRMFKTAEQIFIFVLNLNLHSAAIKSRVQSTRFAGTVVEPNE